GAVHRLTGDERDRGHRSTRQRRGARGGGCGDPLAARQRLGWRWATGRVRHPARAPDARQRERGRGGRRGNYRGRADGSRNRASGAGRRGADRAGHAWPAGRESGGQDRARRRPRHGPRVRQGERAADLTSMLWVGPLVSGGDLFGTTPTVQDDFAWVIVAIIALFPFPLTIEYVVRRPRRYPPVPPRRGRHGSCTRSPISFRSRTNLEQGATTVGCASAHF